MEIIKHGKEYYSTTCENCGCIFTFNGSEIKRERREWYLFDKYQIENSSYITCPECGEIKELENKLETVEKENE